MGELFQQARSLHVAGQCHDAVAAYRRAIDAEPADAEAHNMLGNALADQDRWPEAVECYRRAIEIRPHFADAWFNLGDAYGSLARWNDAAAAYRAALDANPAQPDAAAALRLAQSLHRAGRLDEAIEFYRRATRIQPHSDVTKAARFAALLEVGRLRADGRTEEALRWQRLVIDLWPDDAEPLFLLACMLLREGQLPEGARAFRDGLRLDPRASHAYLSLGKLLQTMGKPTELAALAEAWAAACPDDPRSLHFFAAWTGRAVPPRASADFLRATFDDMASDFDRNLAALDYCAPPLLCGALARECRDREGSLRVLDAGCGTGLCGPLLRPLARRLTGVDLSPRILDEARRRGVYDELVEADLTAYLGQSPRTFDAVVAADTLVYFGDLRDVVTAAADALRAQGVLAFTLERLPETERPDIGYRLQPHGRYSHAESYVRRLLDANGLAVRHLDHAVLRKERDACVQGLVVLAAKVTVE